MDTPPPSPPPPRQRYPTWKQVLVMLLGGLVLAVTACVGFLMSLGGNFERGGNDLTPIAAVLFGAGVLAFLIGVVMLFIRLLLRASAKREPPASGGGGTAPV
jgi:predicted Co/Zn/Cd cation transporter (cation efflux family)